VLSAEEAFGLRGGLAGQLPIIVAHRGLHHQFPENSVEAFRAAVEAGFGWVEFDVQAASDGTPVIIHDETLDRTTMGTGPVARRRGEELRHVRMRFNDMPHAARLPVLKDPPVLSSLDAWLLVEIKAPRRRGAGATRGHAPSRDPLPLDTAELQREQPGPRAAARAGCASGAADRIN
jgi:glycerophosphoryl diester phosphodiesterase